MHKAFRVNAWFENGRTSRGIISTVYPNISINDKLSVQIKIMAIIEEKTHQQCVVL